MEKVKNKYLVVDKETSSLRECRYSDFAIIMDRGTSFDLYKKIFEYVGVPILQIKNEKLTLGDDLLVLKNLINLIVKINLNEIDDEFKYYFTTRTLRVSSMPLPKTRMKYIPLATGLPELFVPSHVN